MPTVFRSGPYRIFFYSADRDEPPHVHDERDRNRARFWLDPVRLEQSGGFRRLELRRIERLITDNAEALLREWDEFFDDQDA